MNIPCTVDSSVGLISSISNQATSLAFSLVVSALDTPAQLT